MCDVAGSDVEYAGMAVYTPHGGRGRSAAGRREKSAHGRKKRLPQRLSSSPSGYLNEQVEEFRNRSLAGTVYPVLWVDALYEKVRVDGRIVSMAILIVCGVDENGHRDIISVEPMAEESRSSYGVLFQNLKDRGLSTPRLIISDTHSGLVSAIRESFPGASWQRCKVHFMRNILVYVPQKEKKAFCCGTQGNLAGAYG